MVKDWYSEHSYTHLLVPTNYTAPFSNVSCVSERCWATKWENIASWEPWEYKKKELLSVCNHENIMYKCHI